VIEDLRQRRQGADASITAAHDSEIQRGDSEPGYRAPHRRLRARQGGAEDRSPTERERDVDDGSGDQEPARTPLAPQEQRAGRTRGLEDVAAGYQRVERGRRSTHDCRGGARDDPIS
jgi:hypothetical protein